MISMGSAALDWGGGNPLPTQPPMGGYHPPSTTLTHFLKITILIHF